jgi:hypothetical protein
MIATLTHLFFPKKVRNYYLFSTSELSLYIKEQSLEASLFVLQGKARTLKHFWTLPYGKHEELLAHLQMLYNATSSSSSIKVILDSSSLFFKKIDLPFHDYEKIRAVLPFELESSLPIPLSEVAFDFVITHKSDTTSSILVAVIQRKTLEERLAPFKELQISVDTVSVDTIEFYRIASSIIVAESGLNIFIALEENNTKLLLFEGNRFLNVRIIIKKLHPEASLIDEVIFTIKTYCTEESLAPSKPYIMLFGNSPAQMKEALHAAFSTECLLFIGDRFFENHNIVNMTNTQCTLIPYPCIPTFHVDQEFNINHQSISAREFLLFQKNIITGCLLAFTILGLLGFHILSQIKYLEKRLAADQAKIIAVMKKTFPSVEEELSRVSKKASASKKINSAARQITDALNLAHKDIAQESSILSSFSDESRNSFLENLVTLSTKIDRETLGLELKKMTLNKTSITLEGRVRNFEALEQFERALKETELFASIPDMQKVDFSISLPLEQKGTRS